MKTRQDIYLPSGYLRPGTIAEPGTPSEVLPQVLQYFAPKGARLPHKFRQTFRNNRLFKMWESGKFYVDKYDNQEIYDFLTDLQAWAQIEEQNLPFFVIEAWLPKINPIGIYFDQDWYFKSYANGKHQVFKAIPTRKPHGLWALETPTEIHLYRSRKHLYIIQK